MASEPPVPDSGAPGVQTAAAPTAVARAKYRVRFQKAGNLRLVSHHDLLHCVERMFRRAALPVASTQGFNPRPRISFAQSLALGVIGLREVLELELTVPLDAAEVEHHLAAQCPPGLAILSVRPIDYRARAQVRRAYFRLPLKEPIPDLVDRCTAFLAQEQCWIQRTRPHPRRLNLRPFVGALRATDGALEMGLWVSPHGSARPEEVAEVLGLRAVLDAGAVLERTDLELTDETTDAALAPEGLPTHPDAEKSSREEKVDTGDGHKAAPRPTAIIAGPMSFDS